MIFKPSVSKIMEMFPSCIARPEAVILKDLMDRGKFHEFMDFANEVLSGYGIEPIYNENNCTIALYVNRGDTYDTTFLYDIAENRFYITSWGDWYEEWSQGKRQEKFKKGDKVKIVVPSIFSDYDLKKGSIGIIEKQSIFRGIKAYQVGFPSAEKCLSMLPHEIQKISSELKKKPKSKKLKYADFWNIKGGY